MASIDKFEVSRSVHLKIYNLESVKSIQRKSETLLGPKYE